MKTLLISQIFPPSTGGSGRWFYEVYSRLSADEYLIAGGEHPDAPTYDVEHTELNIRRWPLKMPTWGVLSKPGFANYYKLLKLTLALVKQEKIQALHCARNLPEGLICRAVSILKGLPYLTYVHGEELQTLGQSRELVLLSKQVYGGARCIIVNSKNTARLVIEHYPSVEDKIRILHPGVHSDYFVPADSSLAIRKKLGWSDRTVMLTVGRLQRRKGQDHAILALKKIKEKIPNILYAIIGNGDEWEYLNSLVTEHGLQNHVQFKGEITDADLLHCYQQCDLFTLPNREINGDIEGFGMVLVEAQSCAKPVLAGKSGGTAETMIPGTTGLIADCTQPDQIADAVLSILSNSDRCKQMGVAARKWVVENLDWPSLVDQAVTIFDELR